MPRSSLCDYSAYILVSETIAVAALAEGRRNNGIKVVFKNCAPFTDCIRKVNNTQIDNDKHIDVIMPMYNLIEYSNNLKSSGSLLQYYRDEIALANNGVIAEFSAADNSALFKFKQKITGVADNNGRKNVEIIVKLKYLSSFWRTLECL